MTTATSLILIAVGAILAFATNVSVSGLDLNVVGYILMIVGVLGLIMLLHAERLAFEHPFTGEQVEAHAAPDAEFAKALALFGAT